MYTHRDRLTERVHVCIHIETDLQIRVHVHVHTHTCRCTCMNTQTLTPELIFANSSFGLELLTNPISFNSSVNCFFMFSNI